MERQRLIRASVLGTVLALGAAGCGAATGAQAATRQKVSSVTLKGYGAVIADSKDHSAYLLEKNGHALSCTGTCTALWPPLLVPQGSKLQGASGMSGTLSLKARGGKDQVLYNGWPLYTYTGDRAARQSHGENIQSFGGTWHLVRAAATAHAKTPVLGSGSGGAGSGGSGGGGGW